MPEYIIFNPLTGRILEKFYSVPPSVVEGKANVLEVARDIFNALTKFHVVEAGKVRLMTQAEQDALLAEEAQAAIDEENARLAKVDTAMAAVVVADFSLIKTDLVIDGITTLAEAKTFLKKLTRYVAKHLTV